MKVKTIAFCLLFIGLLIAGSMPAVYAHEGEHDEDKVEGAMNVENSTMLSPVWKKIKAAEKELKESVDSGNLKPVHDLAGDISKQIKELEKRTAKDQLTEDQMQKVTTSAQRIDEVAGRMHDYADAGNQADTKKELEKLSKLLNYVYVQYGEEMNEGHNEQEHHH